MDKSYFHTRIAVAGGSFASTVPSLGAEDFLVSGILAVFGASVSFIVSLFLKHCLKKWKQGHPLFKQKDRKAKK